METIEIEKVDSQLKLTNGIFSCLENRIIIDIQRGHYPNTHTALYFSSKKIDIILRSLLNQQSPEFYYVNNILVRSIFEHYLVAYYISAKCEFENSDKAGREFYHEYVLSEHIKRVSYDISVDDIINKVPKRDVFDEFKKRQPDYANMSKTQMQEIHRIANQFVDIKGIIRYLLHFDAQKTTSKTFHESLPILLNAYNIVSSYVHGGPAAENETFKYFGNNPKNHRIKYFTLYCKMISYAIKQRLLTSLISTSSEYSKTLIPIEYFILNNCIK